MASDALLAENIRVHETTGAQHDERLTEKFQFFRKTHVGETFNGHFLQIASIRRQTERGRLRCWSLSIDMARQQATNQGVAARISVSSRMFQSP